MASHCCVWAFPSSSLGDPAHAALGLVVFGFGTALAMTAVSVVFGWR